MTEYKETSQVNEESVRVIEPQERNAFTGMTLDEAGHEEKCATELLHWRPAGFFGKAMLVGAGLLALLAALTFGGVFLLFGAAAWVLGLFLRVGK